MALVPTFLISAMRARVACVRLRDYVWLETAEKRNTRLALNSSQNEYQINLLQLDLANLLMVRSFLKTACAVSACMDNGKIYPIEVSNRIRSDQSLIGSISMCMGWVIVAT